MKGSEQMSNIQLIFFETISKIQSQIKDSEAENTSSYSDLLEWRFPADLFRKARDCKLLLIALSFMGLPDLQQNRFRQRVHAIAEYNQLQGQWAEVEELLLLQTNVPGEILQWYLNKHSVEAWFGTDLKRIIKIIRSARTYNPYKPNRSKVNHPQRKRGYNDKGSLSRVDKLTLEHWYRPKETTEIPDICANPFYPEWYAQEKNLQQEGLRVALTFPPPEEGEDND